MASAATTPTPTDFPRLVRSELVMDGPLRETWTFGPSAVWAAVMTLWAPTAVICAVCLSQVTRAKAMVPERLICAAPARA